MQCLFLNIDEVCLSTVDSQSLSFSLSENSCNAVKTETEAKVQALVSTHKAKIKDIVADQTREWSDLVQRQMMEEHEIKKAHVLQQTELLKKLMEDAQGTQLKDMELRQER